MSPLALLLMGCTQPAVRHAPLDVPADAEDTPDAVTETADTPAQPCASEPRSVTVGFGGRDAPFVPAVVAQDAPIVEGADGGLFLAVSTLVEQDSPYVTVRRRMTNAADGSLLHESSGRFRLRAVEPGPWSRIGLLADELLWLNDFDHPANGLTGMERALSGREVFLEVWTEDPFATEDPPPICASTVMPLRLQPAVDPWLFDEPLPPCR